MANRDVQFASNTMKYESDSYIKGSNGLYVFQFGTGTNRDLRQELINYHAKKRGLEDLVKDSNPSKNIGECFWGVFKKPEGQSYEDFIDDVKHSRVGFIGNSPIIPTARDYTRLDMNGNLLVATINSKLDNYLDGCGNMLIDGMTGNVIRSPRPSVIINPADKNTGYYPIEIYKTKENKDTGVKEVYDREYNFLDSDGKILCDEYNFQLKDEEEIIQVPRNFYVRDGKCVYNSWEIQPYAYVQCRWNGVRLFPTVTDLLVENRDRIANGELPILQDETPYLKEYYYRKNEIDVVTEMLGKAFDSGKITEKIYQQALNILNQEYDKIDFFDQHMATDEDRRIGDQVFEEMDDDGNFRK